MRRILFFLAVSMLKPVSVFGRLCREEWPFDYYQTTIPACCFARVAVRVR